MQLKNKHQKFAFYLVRPTDEQNLDFHRTGKEECRSIRFIFRPPDVLNKITAQAAMHFKVWAAGSSKVSNVHPTDFLIFQVFGSVKPARNTPFTHWRAKPSLSKRG